jgi:GntR family transcriptional repressor for pyruvate dehydrogenase complex
VALSGLVSRHQAMFHRLRQPESPEATRKRSLVGVRSQEKLVGFIENGQGDDAEAHWRKHMEKAGEWLLPDIAQTSVLDVLDISNWP